MFIRTDDAMSFITSPERFANWLKYKVPGGYREVTVEDVRDLTQCELIKRYGHYCTDDVWLIITLLKYEDRRSKRGQKQERQATNESPRCKLCSQPLPPQAEGRAGKPRECCPGCQALRAKERYRRFRGNKKRAVSMGLGSVDSRLSRYEGFGDGGML